MSFFFLSGRSVHILAPNLDSSKETDIESNISADKLLVVKKKIFDPLNYKLRNSKNSACEKKMFSPNNNQ